MDLSGRVGRIVAAVGLLAVATACANQPADPEPAVASPTAHSDRSSQATATTAVTAPPAAEGMANCSYTAYGQSARPADPPPMFDVPATGTSTVTLNMTEGTVAITLNRAQAPCTVNSFESLAKQGFFDDTTCHRLVDQGIYILQCGDPSGTGSGGPGYRFADELTGSEQYAKGVVAMANSGPDTNGSQFFLVWADTQLPPEYTIFGSIDEAAWRDIQLVYVCSPGNPTGRLLKLDEWKTLFELSDRYGFVIAADECYSEIYFDDDAKPIGGLEAAWRLGRTDFRNVVMFSSLSKRSNVPGMRSGFVAGDARILKDFLLYRTYHGCALNPAVQAASVVAWNDEEHVEENRRLYRDKFARITPMLQPWLPVSLPDAGFYYWVRTPIPDTEFARRLQAEYNVTVLPGSYLAREANGVNPGAGFVRIALVADTHECVEAAARIIDFCKTL